MTKIQKVWLWVFLGLFLLPELLWSPVGNFVYELFENTGFPFRDSFLEKTDNINYLSLVLSIQLLGIFAVFVYLVVHHKKVSNKPMLWLGLGLSFLLSVVTFFCFGLSISLRSIGF